MSKNEKRKLLPKLRFPQFQNTENWEEKILSEITDRIEDKVGDRKLITVSISAGIGFVTQAKKFSRDISGQQYKNYILLKRGEFAYNKGNSKKFPQGCIYKLKEFDEVAVPNAFISFRFKDEVFADFYQGYFESNFHGKQLQKFITSGARMDGLLNISAENFFSIILPTPKTKAEQQKIADCLNSLDVLITAQSDRLKALKAHKKGLTQQIFPAPGEMVPKLRFEEFKNGRKWKESVIGEITNVTSGGTPDSTDGKYWNGNIPWMNSGELNKKRIYSVSNRITELGLKESSTKVIPPHCVLIGLAGQGKTRGTAAINYIELCTNQSIASIHPNDKVFNSEFLFQRIDSMYDELRKLSKGEGGRGGLNLQIIKSIKLLFPSLQEQQKIADCLNSLDVLITAQTEKLEALKRHKIGLLQALFPNLI